MSGHLSHPNRARTIAEIFERLVMSKHRLSRIYCCRFKVLAEYMERRHKKLLSENDDRDDIEIWVKENPSHAKLFVDVEGEDADDDDKDLDDEEIVMED